MSYPESTNTNHNLFAPALNSNDGLWHYIQSLDADTVAHLSQPPSPEVAKVIENNILGLLGGLPLEGFGVTITTKREHLSRLLASAMMSGYFLKSAEERMKLDRLYDGLEGEPQI
ncbi:MAG: DUF760 domain-containing protein [Synechococcaceae cyanobacterium RL_1_2]|nr:DUF760 domain-containing protein [Synechococcaceae cyanobacterium RL_1_2]